MPGPVRRIIEVPCIVEAIPLEDVLRQMDGGGLQELGVDPRLLEDKEETVPEAEEAKEEDSEGGEEEPLDTEIGPILDESVKERVQRAVDACLAAYVPHGVYKIFNPVICTLPPQYTEPAIKLVGTMMMFHGEAVYERLRRATHCALLAVSLAAATDEQGNPVEEPGSPDSLDQALLDAARRAFVELAADRINSAIIADALKEDLYTDNRLSPGDGDFPLDTRSQFVFYTQSEKHIGLKLGSDGEFSPRWSTVGLVGMYDPSQKGRRRGCGRCRYRKYCSIRAIGMRCYGGKGSFKKGQ